MQLIFNIYAWHTNCIELNYIIYIGQIQKLNINFMQL